jgi:glyoxylase-like metal-dependent hydrolase (beta-lactamase superfamily II)
MALDIQRISVGPLETNCFLVVEPDSKEALLIDPGAEADRILNTLEQAGGHLVGIVLTHAHGDHIGAVREVKARTGAPLLVHRLEADWLTDPEKNLSALLGLPLSSPEADRLLDEGDTVALGAERLRVLHTPGHSPGGLSLHHDGILLCGDLLFLESVGRCDLPGGDLNTLADSIRAKVYTLPDDTVLYPGHGDATTVGHEKRHNAFVTGEAR